MELTILGSAAVVRVFFATVGMLRYRKSLDKLLWFLLACLSALAPLSVLAWVLVTIYVPDNTGWIDYGFRGGLITFYFLGEVSPSVSPV